MLKKKGFTLTELIIVIVIISVLSSVLIPSFVNVIHKANVSADIQQIRNINVELKVDEISLNGIRQTPSDAFSAVSINNTKVLLTRTKNYYYAWNQKENQFVLFDDEMNVVFPKNFEDNNKGNYWICSNKYIESLADEGYGIFLANDANIENEINTTTNLDVGNNTVDVVYSGSKEKAIVKMHNGTLTVDNPNADVSVYGDIYILDVKDAALTSVTLKGAASIVKLAAGHLVIDDNALVTTIILTEKTEGDKAVIIDIPSEKVEQIKIRKDQDSTLASSVTINDSVLTEEMVSEIPVYTTCSHDSQHSMLSGKTEQEIRTMFGDDASEWTIVSATCTENGIRYFVCNECGERLFSEVLIATGHSYGDEIVDAYATLTTPGSKHFICSACGDRRDEVIEAKTQVDSLDNMTDTSAYYCYNGYIYENVTTHHDEAYPKTNVFNTSDSDFVTGKRFGSGTLPTIDEANYFVTGYIPIPESLKDGNGNIVIENTWVGAQVFHKTTDLCAYILYDENKEYLDSTIQTSIGTTAGWHAQSFKHNNVSILQDESLGSSRYKTTILIPEMPSDAKYIRIQIYGSQPQNLESINGCITKVYFEGEYIPSYDTHAWENTGIVLDPNTSYQVADIWTSAPELYDYTKAFPEGGIKISNHSGDWYYDGTEYYYLYKQNSSTAPNTVDTSASTMSNNNKYNNMFGTTLMPFSYDIGGNETDNKYRLVIPNCLDGNYKVRAYVIFFNNSETITVTTSRIYCQNNVYEIVESGNAAGNDFVLTHKYDDVYELDLGKFANNNSSYDTLKNFGQFVIVFTTTYNAGAVNQNYVDTIGNRVSIKKLSDYSVTNRLATAEMIAASNLVQSEFNMTNPESGFVGYTRSIYAENPEYTSKYGDLSDIGDHFKMAMVKNGVVQYYLSPTDITKKEGSDDASVLDGTDGDMMIVNDVPVYYLLGRIGDFDVVLFSLSHFSYRGVESSCLQPRGDTPSLSYIDSDGVAHYCRNSEYVSSYRPMTNLVGKYVPSYDGNTIVYNYDSTGKFTESGAYMPSYGYDLSTVERAATAKNTGEIVYTNEDLLSKEIMIGLLYAQFGTKYLQDINLYGGAYSGTIADNYSKIEGVFNNSNNTYALNGIRFKDENNNWVYDELLSDKIKTTANGNTALDTLSMLTDWNSPWEIMEQHLVASYAVQNSIEPNVWFVYNGTEYKYQNVGNNNLLSGDEMTCLVFKKFRSQLTYGFYNGQSLAGREIEYMIFSSLFRGWVIDNTPHQWLTGINIVQKSDEIDTSGSSPVITYHFYVERDYTKYIMDQSYTGVSISTLYDFESVYDYAGSFSTAGGSSGYMTTQENSFLIPLERGGELGDEYCCALINTSKFVANKENTDGKATANNNSTNAGEDSKIVNGVKWGYGNWGDETTYVYLYCWHSRNYVSAKAGYSSFVCQNVILP